MRGSSKVTDWVIVVRQLTHAHGLICSGFEAVVAEAAVASLRVNTLSVAADVGDLVALVAI